MLFKVRMLTNVFNASLKKLDSSANNALYAVFSRLSRIVSCCWKLCMVVDIETKLVVQRYWNTIVLTMLNENCEVQITHAFITTRNLALRCSNSPCLPHPPIHRETLRATMVAPIEKSHKTSWLRSKRQRRRVFMSFSSTWPSDLDPRLLW